MIYLIDFENVHEEGFSSLGRLGDRDAVYCFFTKNVAKISMAALAGIRSGQLHFIEAESGKQSLDLALVSYLGYLIGTVPNEQCYEIVSNDNGFAKAADFWNKHRPGIRVRVRKTVDQAKLAAAAEAKPARRSRSAKTAKAAAAAAPVVEAKLAVEEKAAPAPEAKPAPAPAAKSKSAPAQKKASAPKEAVPAAAEKAPAKEAAPAAAAKSAPEAKPASKPEPAKKEASEKKEAPVKKEATAAKPAPAPEAPASGPAPEAVAALVAAGIEAPVAEFLLTEAEKHREDKNIKQLVYRAVVKKYGQKKGTEIYNTAKKVAL